MIDKFGNDLNKLVLHSTYPQEDGWLMSALTKLLNQYGDQVALDYTESTVATIFEISLLIKTGLKNVNMNILLKYLNSTNEDEYYDAAICLAIYNHSIGFDTIKKIIDGFPESNTYNPKLDVLPDLMYIEHSEGRQLEDYIYKSFPHITIENPNSK